MTIVESIDLSPEGSGAYRIRSDEEAINIAKLLADELRKNASERDQERRLPFGEMKSFARSGLTAVTVPREFGGADVSFRTLVDVFRIISAADPSIGQIPQTHFGAVNSLRTIGTTKQKNHYFELVLQGQRFGSATSERGTKHARDFRTRLTKKGERWILNGTKFYCTGSLYADWLQVLALDESDALVRIFIPKVAPGVTILDDWDAFGQRTTASGTAVFDNVEIGDENILPAHLLFDKKVSLQGPIAQIMQAAIDAGIAEAAIHDTQEFVRGRARPWIDSGKDSAGEDPYIVAAIGRLHIKSSAANALLWRAARFLDEASVKPVTEESAAEVSVAVAEAKALTTEIALDAAEKLFELAGTSSTLAEDNFDRHWRNARTHTLHDPIRWKYKLIGNYWINGVKPDRHSFV